MGKTIAVKPSENTNEWVDDQINQYHQENIILDEIISKGPQYKTTATGYPALIFETCDCGSFGDRRSQHSAICGIQAVTDATPVVAALKEKRLNRGQIANLLSLKTEVVQVDTTQLDAIVAGYEDKCRQISDLTAERDDLRRQLALVNNAEIADVVIPSPFISDPPAFGSYNHRGY